jgi:hypothetical protein
MNHDIYLTGSSLKHESSLQHGVSHTAFLAKPAGGQRLDGVMALLEALSLDRVRVVGP